MGADVVVGRVRPVLLVVALAGVMTGCASHAVAGGERHGVRTASFVDGGVRVTLTLHSSGGRAELTARFTPLLSGFHLYSTDLPSGGVQGIGQRTSVTVSGAWRAAGRLHTDSRVRLLSYPALHLRLPVYPDGPLTTTLTLHANAGTRTDARVSYAACSSGRCLPPVLGHRIAFAR